VRKAIAKNGDMVTENHASQMRDRAFWKVGSRGSGKIAKQKEGRLMSTPLNPDEFTHTRQETEQKEPWEQDDHANTQDDAPPLGKRYDVGSNRQLMLHHEGSGTPAVVIEAGAGAFGLDYLNLFELCAKRTTCVLYDRAGSGWSDPVQGPRSVREIVADLHNALSQALIEGPYLLVGHSLGGLLVRAFAQHIPDEVVGLVLIDPLAEGIPLPEEGDETVVQAMLSELRRNPDIAREWYPTLFAEWEKLPAQICDPLIARHLDPDHAIVGLRDMQNARRIQEEVTNGPRLPNVPVTVLTGMQIDPMPGSSDEDKHAFNQIKLKAHATLVSSLPQAEHRVLQDAGHLLYTQRPDVVAQAVFDILDRRAR
jgi:pimeloyl-ACP methyl ester carboxylesterase